MSGAEYPMNRLPSPCLPGCLKPHTLGRAFAVQRNLWENTHTHTQRDVTSTQPRLMKEPIYVSPRRPMFVFLIWQIWQHCVPWSVSHISPCVVSGVRSPFALDFHSGPLALISCRHPFKPSVNMSLSPPERSHNALEGPLSLPHHTTGRRLIREVHLIMPRS